MKKSTNNSIYQVPGGEFDNYGFYYSPDGSFWDPDGIYFNVQGYDSHGGYYDDNLEYCPGPGWIDELLCYEDEKKEKLSNKKFKGRKSGSSNLAVLNEEEFEDEGDEDEIDYDKLLNEQGEKLENIELKEDYDNKENIITVDMLFNKFPDNLKPLNNDIYNGNKKEEKIFVKVEKIIEIDSLFG